MEDEGRAQEEEPPPLEPSRAAYLSAGQGLEVWYPGRGWSFEGFRESGATGGIAFSSRRFEDGDTLFFFRSSRPGVYILDFSRFDIPTGRYIADALRVEVFPQGGLPAFAEQALVRPGVARAPDYEGLGAIAAQHSARMPPAMPATGEESDVAPAPAPAPSIMEIEEGQGEGEGEPSDLAAERGAGAIPSFGDGLADGMADEPSVAVAPAARAAPAPRAEAAQPAPRQEESGAAGASLAAAQASSIVEEGQGEGEARESAAAPAQASAGSEAAPALSEIRAMIDAGDIDGALSALGRFFAEYADSTDEALFLQGQAYEANSPRRDMRRALSAYETLTQAYPLSRFWQDADRRIRYIRRFYFDMR